MKTHPTLPTISMADFFALPAVLALQAIQKRSRYGSPAHRAAHAKMVALANGYVTQGRNELVRCSYFFGDY